jgi:hypothetical protein
LIRPRLAGFDVTGDMDLGIALYLDGNWKDSAWQFQRVAATNELAQHYLNLLQQKSILQGER